MNYNINEQNIVAILYFLKIFFINIGTLCIFEKLINKKVEIKKKYVFLISLTIISFIATIIKEVSNSLYSMIVQILMMTVVLKEVMNFNTIRYSLIGVVSAFSIGNILFFISTFINSIPNIILGLNNDYIALLFMILIYFILVKYVISIKRLNNGLSFLNNSDQNEFFDMIILNLGAVTLSILLMFSNYNKFWADKIAFSIVIISIIMFLTIKKSFDIYYKQKLLIKELEENKKEIEQKNQEIKKLEEENLNFSKKSHSLAHKQKSLEYKINQLALKTELSEELDIKEQFKNLSKELYTEPVQELDKTNIVQIDDMLKFMQSECIKNDIEFRLQIYGNIYHIINNIITKDQLEILIADHVKDAIIAIKHTDNINKSILVKLGKIEGCYGLYIYDSGVEFKKEILENLGKKPSTAYPEEGGTGMGFMNTFDTLKGCNGSLIIKELGKLSKDNYTKIIMIKFDGKNEFKVVN